jgi:hypothetical protein
MNKVLTDSIMAATDKLVKQAMSGNWKDIPTTLQQRRELLDQLMAAVKNPADHTALNALRQAVAESEAAVKTMAPATTAGERSWTA